MRQIVQGALDLRSGSRLPLSTSRNRRGNRASFRLLSSAGPHPGPQGTSRLRDGVIWKEGAQTATPRSWGRVKGRAGLIELPKWVGASSSSVAAFGARGGDDSYPEAAELEVAVGRSGCCNPLGAAGPRALWAAGTRSCWRRSRVGTARLGHSEQAGCSGGRCRRWRALPPAGLPAGLPTGSGGGSGRGEAAVGRSWAPSGSRGRRGPRNSAAGDWSPPLQRQSSPPDARGFSKHRGRRGHSLDVK
ncbi:collagen alpha-2(I) chain-like [Camelus ferus]|uniref:Collagen alpha-2(I) chain-like n=1 Tax=Camelus ferus TaxID=419612 RepID=A0A8B8SYW2_CAMFR|nr:collagen alpha-2(I) chain-like [Camelus ferus]